MGKGRGIQHCFRKAWSLQSGIHLFKLHQKIKAVRSPGKEWAGKKRLAAKSTIKIASQLQTVASELQLDPHNIACQCSFNELKAKLIELQCRELMDIQQRVHINLITKGDQGTNFFAQAIRARQAKNSIMSTLDCNGRQTNSLVEMKARAVDISPICTPRRRDRLQYQT